MKERDPIEWVLVILAIGITMTLIAFIGWAIWRDSIDRDRKWECERSGGVVTRDPADWHCTGLKVQR